MSLNHKGTIKIETERLILRKIELEDRKSLFDNLISDPKVSETFMMPWYAKIEDMEPLFQRLIERGSGLNQYLWAVEIKENHRVIGIITCPEQKDEIGEIEVGYAFGSKYWNRGYATEAVKPVIDFFFNQVGYQKIVAGYFAGNEASGRVMQKCGMKYSGHREKEVLYKDCYHDTENYEIIKGR